MANYTTQNNQDLFYVVNTTIGDLNSVYTFLKDNTSFGVSFVPVGVVATYTRVFTPPPVVDSQKPPEPVTSQSYFSRQNQNIYDIALMTSTDLNKIYDLMIASNFNNVITIPKAGTEFIYNPQLITDKILSKFAIDNSVIFNTSTRIEPPLVIADGEKEFQDGTLFVFQDSVYYDFQN